MHYGVVPQRDRDLELAARIGQSLLQRNHVLQERNESLEEQLAQALDQVGHKKMNSVLKILFTVKRGMMFGKFWMNKSKVQFNCSIDHKDFEY